VHGNITIPLSDGNPFFLVIRLSFFNAELVQQPPFRLLLVPCGNFSFNSKKKTKPFDDLLPQDSRISPDRSNVHIQQLDDKQSQIYFSKIRSICRSGHVHRYTGLFLYFGDQPQGLRVRGIAIHGQGCTDNPAPPITIF
jgi:hypothetical protein